MKHARSQGTGAGMFVALLVFTVAFAVLLTFFTPEALVGLTIGALFPLWMMWASRDVATLEDRYGERAALREAAEQLERGERRDRAQPTFRPRHP